MDKTASFNNQFRLAHKCILLRTRPMTGPIFLSRTNPCMTPMTNKTSGKFLFAIHPFVHSFLGRSRVVVSYLKPFPAHPLTRTICGWYGFNMRRWRQWNQSKGNQNRIKCYSSLYPSLARTHWSIHSILSALIDVAVRSLVQPSTITSRLVPFPGHRATTMDKLVFEKLLTLS